jgi:hypothetical protein
LVQRFTAPQNFDELGVCGRHPFDQEVLCCESAAQRGDVTKRYLTAEQQMVNDGEHENGIEMAIGAVEKRSVFVVLPARCGRGIGEVDAEWQYVSICALKFDT